MLGNVTSKSPSAIAEPASYEITTWTASPALIPKVCPEIEATEVVVAVSLPTWTLRVIPLHAAATWLAVACASPVPVAAHDLVPLNTILFKNAGYKPALYV